MSAWVSGLPSNSSGRSAGNLTTPVLRRRDPNNTARSPSTRNSPSVIRFVISSHLDNHRGTHSAARAHRQHADAAAAAAQFIYRRRHHARAGRGDRMAKADARAVDVDDLFVKAEFAAVTETPSVSGCSTFSPASDSIELPRRGCSSWANVIVVPSALGTSIGMISSVNDPASMALIAR